MEQPVRQCTVALKATRFREGGVSCVKWSNFLSNSNLCVLDRMDFIGVHYYT